MYAILIQIVLLQLVFGLIYEALLRRETFFVANRSFLLLTLGFSFLLPFVELNIPNTLVTMPAYFWLDEVVVHGNLLPEIQVASQETTIQTSNFPVFSILYWIWIFGSVFFLGRFLVKIFQLQRLKKQAIVSQFKNQKVYQIPGSTLAFSFFNFIFIGENVPVESLNTLIKHEQIHVKQKHSLDLLLLEMLKIVLWWNPMVYWFQARLSELHEFLADARCKNKNNYYEKLLQTFFEVPNMTFTNSFFSKSLIKTRMMMLQKKSNPRKTWRYAMALPVIAVMLFLNCTQEAIVEPEAEPAANLSEKELVIFYMEEAMLKKKQGISYKEQIELIKNGSSATKKEHNVIKIVAISFLDFDEEKALDLGKNWDNVSKNHSLIKPNFSINPDAIPFALVNTVPVYENANPTDKDFFQSFIQKHIRENFVYPNEAMDAGIQGRVFVSFTIDEFGEININGVRGPSPILEDAVHELMLKLPKASAPATIDGKPVDMKMSVPITFKLN
uniref:energy transducer TonB n=1 Tax=Flavobacterium sp. TaxID=239 RepID=UPI004049E93C